MRSLLRSLPLALSLAACDPSPAPLDAGGSDAPPALDAPEGTDAPVVPDAGPPTRRPPARPTADAPTGDPLVLVVEQLYLGDTLADGTADPGAWRTWGYDLDGRISDGTDPGLCMPREGASPASAHQDGDDGIDNAFGRSVLPILRGLASDYSVQVNDDIRAGEPTLLVAIDALGTSPDATPLVGGIVSTTSLGDVPRFDGSDVFDVDPAWLSDVADPSAAIASFTDGYRAEGTIVLTPAGTLGLRLRSLGVVPITHAIVTVEPDGSHGTLAGILSTDEITARIRRLAGTFDPSLCVGATIDSIVAQIEQASDILADGTQDETRPCDGISIGLGFVVAEASVGGVGPETPEPPDPCVPTP
jgi:hypothetical protein